MGCPVIYANTCTLYNQINLEIQRKAPGAIFGIAVKDLVTGEKILLNSDVPFLPASVIKIPVMVEVYHQVALGKLSMQEPLILKSYYKLPGSGNLQYLKDGSPFTIERLVDLMITDSDNTATHMLIARLGSQNINRYMRQLGLKKTIIKDYTLIEKSPGLCNISSPDDMLHLLELMYKKQLISARVSTEMLSIMKRQHHRWGIPRFLPAHVIIANKTGSMDHVRNDVGIIFDQKHPYIVVIFSKKIPPKVNGSILVGFISKIIYEAKLSS